MGVSGANFAVAETGSVCVFESEGNGRMCTTLPELLVTVMGVEKVVPAWRDMEVFLQLLPRSSTGERMNPYTSVWTRRRRRVGDGPREFHLVLLDNGRVRTLADELGRQALRCIRCSACLNVCPVYARVGGHAYGSVYPGPIGAILTPQLKGIEGDAGSLPYASSLCGACGDVCPVKIEIPRLLTHLRAREVDSRSRLDPEKLTMKALFHTFSSRNRYERAQKLARAASRPLARGGGKGSDAKRRGAAAEAAARAAAARSAGRPGRWPAGRCRATCPHPRRRPSGSGGAAPEGPAPPSAPSTPACEAAARAKRPARDSCSLLHAYRAKRGQSGGGGGRRGAGRHPSAHPRGARRRCAGRSAAQVPHERRTSA